jgi:hypothetical protein
MFSCYYDGTGYVCACPVPYTGRRCETNMNGNFKNEFVVLWKMVFVGVANTCAANPNYCKNGGT